MAAAGPRQAAAEPRRGPGRPSNFDARREEIIRTATRLFAEKGFHGTSMADLCEATGMGRGVVYHYISSKEEILAEIHERFVVPFLEEAERTMAEESDPVRRLRRLSRALLGSLESYKDEVTVFLHEWRAIRGERWAEVRAKRRAVEQIIQRTVEEGQAAGVFRPCDARLAALAFLDMHNYAYQWFDPKGRLGGEEISRLFADIYLDGIVVRP